MSPSGVAIDAQGRIFVSDRGDRVQMFAPDQVFSADPLFLGSWGGPGDAAGTFNGPYGVAVDDAGRVYVAEDFGLRLQAFQLQPPFAPVMAPIAERPAASPEPDAASPVELVWATTGRPDLPLDDPYKPAIDPGGNGFIYVSDEGRDTVSKFRLVPPLAPE